jgi:hypothetical protein
MKWTQKVKAFLKNHPSLNSIILPAFILFTIGFAVGYYVALLVQKQTSVFGIPAIVIAGFGGLGALSNLSKTIIDWYSAKKEREKIPILEFDGYIKTIESEIVSFGGNTKKLTTYFIRIKDTNPKTQGKIENAEGFLEVKGNSPQTSLKRTATIWSDNNQRYLSFSRQADLRLFIINETENIIFPSAKEKQDFTSISNHISIL